MQCNEVRRILWPADSLRLGDEKVEEALRHAESCARCHAFLDRDRQLAQLIRESVPRAQAPRELRERLFTALARERAGTPPQIRQAPWGRRSLAFAAMLLVAVSVGGIAYRISNPAAQSGPAEAFAQDYLRRVFEQESMYGTDTEISAFFARELGVAMRPPEIPGFEVERALICLLNGRRGGVIEYKGEDQHLSFYMVPDGGSPITEPVDMEIGQVTGDANVSVAPSGATALSVATWQDGVHQHALIGNVDAEELRDLAERYACPVARS